jgi:hypothetical protein
MIMAPGFRFLIRSCSDGDAAGFGENWRGIARRFALVNFVVGANGEQEDRLDALVLYEFKYDSQIIGGAAGPAAGQVAF